MKTAPLAIPISAMPRFSDLQGGGFVCVTFCKHYPTGLCQHFEMVKPGAGFCNAMPSTARRVYQVGLAYLLMFHVLCLTRRDAVAALVATISAANIGKPMFITALIVSMVCSMPA